MEGVGGRYTRMCVWTLLLLGSHLFHERRKGMRAWRDSCSTATRCKYIHRRKEGDGSTEAASGFVLMNDGETCCWATSLKTSSNQATRAMNYIRP